MSNFARLAKQSQNLMKKFRSEPTRFLIVGGINYVFAMCTLPIITKSGVFGYSWINLTVSTICCSLFSFIMHRKFTFKYEGKTNPKRLANYVTKEILVFGFGLVCLYTFYEWLNWDILLVNFIIVSGASAISYLWLKHLVFQQ